MSKANLRLRKIEEISRYRELKIKREFEQLEKDLLEEEKTNRLKQEKDRQYKLYWESKRDQL
jgi:hypothetical protein